MLLLLEVMNYCTFSVLLERAESPTLSYASANSHQSMDTDEEDEEENSAPKEK